MPKYTKDQLDNTSQSRLDYYETQLETEKLRYQRVNERFGKNGKISSDLLSGKKPYNDEDVEKYNSITLPDVPGMDDDMISLIGVGVSFDKKYVRKTSSSPGNLSPEDFHCVFVTSNIIPADPRTIDYSGAMPKIREETKNVLEEYNKGNKEPVKKALRNIADYIKNDSGTLEFNSNQADGIYNKGFYKTIGKFMNDPDLGVEKMFSEKDLLRVKANAKKLDAYEKSNNAAKELLLNPADANTPEREQQVLDYMLNMATASVTSKSVVNEEDSYNDLVDSISDFIDNDPRLVTDEEGMSKTSTDIIVDLNQTIAQKVDDKKAASAKYKFAYDNVIGNKSSSLLRDIYQKDNVAPEEAILSEENGEEKLKEQLKTKIKESDLYQSLMNAKTPKEMSMALNKADMKFRAKGLDAIPHDKFESDLAKKASLGKTEEYKKTIDKFRKDFRLLNSGSAVRKDLESVTAGINAQPARFNVFQKGHKDSKSIENLREKTAEFEKILYTVTKEPAMDDPKARKALFEAYKASIEYQNEKMTAAGVDPTNTKWEPTSSMGKERFRGARKIEELAKEFIMDEIMEYENDLAKEENFKHENETVKKISEAKYDNNTIQGQAYEQAISELKENSEAHPFGDMSSEIAKVMAVKMVSDVYKTMKIKVNDKTKDKFYDDINKTAEQLQTRDDFKYLMSKKPLEAEKAALEDGGKRLLPMLAMAKRTMPEKIEKVQRAPTAPTATKDIKL